MAHKQNVFDDFFACAESLLADAMRVRKLSARGYHRVLRVARTLSPSPAIVLITGYSSYDSAIEAMDIGAHDYIEKPIHDVEDLRFRIRRNPFIFGDGARSGDRSKRRRISATTASGRNRRSSPVG